jgi:hypothetical protein
MRSMKLYARGITNALIESEKTDRRRNRSVLPSLAVGQSFHSRRTRSEMLVPHASGGVAQFMREKALFWNAALGHRADLQP